MISSLPTRGAWIEIVSPSVASGNASSLPTRGAWIEIRPYLSRPDPLWSLPTRGAWIEILCFDVDRGSLCRRSPHGERGLKWRDRQGQQLYGGSLPTRGAWIEIPPLLGSAASAVSLPTRGAWIEIVGASGIVRRPVLSLPTRGAWIEMEGSKPSPSLSVHVAPHTGSVD